VAIARQPLDFQKRSSSSTAICGDGDNSGAGGRGAFWADEHFHAASFHAAAFRLRNDRAGAAAFFGDQAFGGKIFDQCRF
jgi:hypothetical protein